jgi:FkbM family methyltransferase
MAIIESSRIREQSIQNLWRSKLGLKQKILRTPLRLIPSSTTVKVLSGVNRGRRWIVGASNHSCWVDNYESEKQALLIKRICPGYSIWDVGANVGFYTLAFSRYVGQAGSVTAFEPMASNVALLREHLAMNSALNVAVIQAAVADSSGLARFSNQAHSSMGKIEESQSGYVIPKITLDQLPTWVRGPNVIKIDVEGAEGLVLRGGRDIIAKYRPELWIALHGELASLQVYQELQSLGYSVHALNNDRLTFPFGTDEIVAKPSA